MNASLSTERPIIIDSSIGLMGMGLMGSAMAGRLERASVDFLGWDIDPNRRSTFASRMASSAQQVASTCDMILLSLPDDEVVRSLIAEIGSCLRPNQIVIDTSTGDPKAAELLGQWLEEKGVGYVEATVSGSSVQLAVGEAVFMVGASVKALDRSHPLLQLLSNRIVHVGSVGNASKMKLVTNLVLGLNRAALAEGLAYGRALGLDWSSVFRMLRESMAYSKIMDTKGEKMMTGDFTPQAKLAQHRKDVRLILESARRVGLDLPLSNTHAAMLDRAVELGLGEWDNSAIIEIFRHASMDSDGDRAIETSSDSTRNDHG